MDPFTMLDAIACPLDLENIDTDQLIPARFMKQPRSKGYGGFLLHDLRFEVDSAPQPRFALNHARYGGAGILVTRRNFGTGSSREAAVYALWDHGIRCVIAPSFGDIFASNAVKNGLLPANVEEAAAEELLAWLAAADTPRVTINLETLQICAGPIRLPFTLDPVRRLQLLNGWDDIDLTEQHRETISAFRAARATTAPWIWPKRQVNEPLA
jgi:3-isopropylmalate/(R)-2-methylmalate dehydratase small subunit